MCELPKFLIDSLHEIANAEGFVDYSTEVQAGSNHGDGFQGIITSIVISGTRERNGIPSSDKLSLLFKTVPTNVTRRKEFQSDTQLKREAFMYSTVLPLFAEFQRAKGLSDSESFLSYPKCYKTIASDERDEFIIIMEDLRPKHFKMWPKSQVIPSDHARLTVVALAKFHAVSFALKDQRPAEFEPFKNLHDIMMCNLSTSMRNIMHMTHDRAIKSLQDPAHIQIVEKFKGHTEEAFQRCLKAGVSEPFGVIGHSDFWINNLLFRYKNGVSGTKCDYICNLIHPKLIALIILFICDRHKSPRRFLSLIGSYRVTVRLYWICIT